MLHIHSKLRVHSFYYFFKIPPILRGFGNVLNVGAEVELNSGKTASHVRQYPKVSGLAAWSENCRWYTSLPLGAIVSLFCESV
jgi:hypothetical protein